MNNNSVDIALGEVKADEEEAEKLARIEHSPDESTIEDVLSLGRDLGVHDVEGQRILQVFICEQHF